MVANEQQVLYFDDVKEGDQAPVKKHRITRTDMVRYAGASGDYMPMHLYPWMQKTVIHRVPRA